MGRREKIGGRSRLSLADERESRLRATKRLHSLSNLWSAVGMRATILILLATATFAMGQKYGRGSDTGVDFLVQRARMVLADPGRWAPEHVARARQILATYQAQQEAARREAEYRWAEQERAAREQRIRDMERRLNDLESEDHVRRYGYWSGR
jgi:hypothetical protein